MITGISIENFRGLRSVDLRRSKRINILVGRNGTGKTAFLEAIYLASGSSPELLVRTRNWRGRDALREAPIDVVSNWMYEDTFRDPAIGRASIILRDGDRVFRSIEILRSGDQERTISGGSEGRLTSGMQFIYDDGTGPQPPIVPEITEQGLSFKFLQSQVSTHLLASRSNVSEAETARLYSSLRLEGAAEAFEKALLSEFPLITEITIEAPWGSPAIYGRMKSGRKLPLTMISSGINHLAGIMIRLIARKGTLLLIDEVENGFYYDRYPSIWSALHDLAVQGNCQIFATTHSMECLRAIKTALAKTSDDVSFLRSSMIEHEIVFEELSGDSLFSALELGEVR